MRTLFWLLFSLLLLVRVPSLVQPAGGDQGLYAYVGQRILAGEVPYRDAWDQKPPGIHYTYALLSAIRPDLSIVPAADLIVAAASALLLLALGRRLGPPGAGELAALLFLLYTNPALARLGGARIRAQCEVFIGLFATAGFLLLHRASVRYARAVNTADVRHRRGTAGALTLALIAGLCFGLAFAYKYNAGIYLIVGVMAVLLWTRRTSIEPPRARRTRAGTSATGRAWTAAPHDPHEFTATPDSAATMQIDPTRGRASAIADAHDLQLTFQAPHAESAAPHDFDTYAAHAPDVAAGRAEPAPHVIAQGAAGGLGLQPDARTAVIRTAGEATDDPLRAASLGDESSALDEFPSERELAAGVGEPSAPEASTRVLPSAPAPIPARAAAPAAAAAPRATPSMVARSLDDFRDPAAVDPEPPGMLLGEPVRVPRTPVEPARLRGVHLTDLMPLTLWLVIGFATIVGLLVGYFTAVGALRDLYDATIAYNVFYSGETYATRADVLQYLVTFPVTHARVEALWFLGGLACVVLVIASLWRPAWLVPALWVGAACVSIAVNGRRGLPQYFLQAGPALALAAGVAGMAVWHRTGRIVRTVLIVALAVAALRVQDFGKAIDYTAYDVRYWQGGMTRDAYLSRFGGRASGDKYSALAVEELARYLQANVPPQERVLHFGFSQGALAQAHRASATRFFWSRPLIVGFKEGTPGYGVAGLLSELTRTRPYEVVLQRRDWDPDTLDSATWFLHQEPLAEWLRAHYQPAQEMGNFLLYRRADAPDAVPAPTPGSGPPSAPAPSLMPDAAPAEISPVAPTATPPPSGTAPAPPAAPAAAPPPPQ